MSLSDSRFHMWRAVTAMMHADSVVRPHEINFVLQSTKTLGMTAEQQSILMEDLQIPADMVECYSKITSPKDKEDFFHLAHALAWSDGNMDEREEAMLDRIRALAKGPDRALLEKAGNMFKDIQIDGAVISGMEPSVMSFIKNLVGSKRA